MAYKTGIIGYGHMGRHYHATRVRELTDCVVPYAAYDIRPAQLDDAIADGLKPYYTLEEFLADPEIDIAVIATPNHVHKKLAIAALRAGKNVICEKPVTLNASELEEIIAVAKETGKQFAVHQNRRWDGNFVKVKQIIESGLIGEPFYIKHRIQGGGGAVYGWRSDVLNGGGFLMDWGIHLLDRAIWMMRAHKIVEVSGTVRNIRSQCDDNAIVNITFDNGCRLLVETMQYAFSGEPLWTVHGDRGCIMIQNEDDKTGRVIVSTVTGEHYAENLCYREQGPVTIKSRVIDEKFDTVAAPELDVPSDPKAGNDWSKYYENYVAALEGREELIVTPEQSLRLMRVIDMIYESSRLNHAIQCCL